MIKSQLGYMYIYTYTPYTKYYIHNNPVMLHIMYIIPPRNVFDHLKPRMADITSYSRYMPGHAVEIRGDIGHLNFKWLNLN